jgi:hypothetical protein
MWQDSAGRHGTWSKTCVALIRHTPGLRTPHGQNAAFTRRGMENPQVSGHSDGQGWAPCKTVGYAFPGSNPGPATITGNSPWPAHVRLCSCFARSRGFTAVPGDPTRRTDQNGLVDVDAFIRDGYVVIRGAFGPGAAAACRAGIEPPGLRRWLRQPGCPAAAEMRVPVTCLGIGLASAGPTREAGLPYGAPAKLRVIAHPHGRPRPRRRSCRVSHH